MTLMDAPIRLLVISRRPGLYQALRKTLPPAEISLLASEPDADFLKPIVQHDVRTVLIDADGPPRGALPVLKKIKKCDALIDVIVAATVPDPDGALEVVKQGAADVLARPLRRDEFLDVLQRIRDKRALRRETYELERKLEEKYVFQGLVSRHPPMLKVFGLIEQVAKHFTAVLVTGEPGTGKTTVARALHRLSPARSQPFSRCACAAVPKAFFEAALFGSPERAPAGPGDEEPGLIETAQGGVVFLDEIAEVPLSVQARLLAVLEQRPSPAPASGESPGPVVRIIAATNRDLVEAVRAGVVDGDLFEHLRQMEIHLPPLRDRREDILLLVRTFLDRIGRKLGRDLKGVSPDVQKILYDYPWPGNVAELESVLEGAARLAKTDFIDAGCLPKPLRDLQADEAPGPFVPHEHLSTLADLEKQYIAYLLKTTRRNLKRTAQILGVSRTTLYNKLKRYKIPLY
jgi:DNA-binding NtrC family response regulator